MNVLLGVLLIGATVSIFAEEIYQVRPDGERDYTKPSYAKEGDKVYQKRPNGERDYTKPSYVIQGDKVYQRRTDGEPDYTKPSRKIK
jgi:hypothetical protein